MNIPKEAVDAAVKAHSEGTMRAALEAAVTYMVAERKLDEIRHHLRGENWAGGETPKRYQPILDIIDGTTK